MELKELITKANQVYQQNFGQIAWYGRCIFLSWYCKVGTCRFCFRSTLRHKAKYKKARRSLASVLTEAMLCKKLGWRIEFLTGGYGILPLEDLVEITKKVSQVYGEKIWLNLGALKEEELKEFKPYVKGVVASVETLDLKLHKFLCPDKDLFLYEEMLKKARGFKKSITLVIGVGEKKEDFSLLVEFIRKYQINRLTFYALKPVKGTFFENSPGPKREDYLWWIAQTRIAFPRLEIIAGTTFRRYKEVSWLLRAGANAFTKFPATKKFGTKESRQLEESISLCGRKFRGTLTRLPNIDWDKEITCLGLENQLEREIKHKLRLYLERMKKTSFKQKCRP